MSLLWWALSCFFVFRAGKEFDEKKEHNFLCYWLLAAIVATLLEISNNLYNISTLIRQLH